MKQITFNDNGTVTIDGQDFYPGSKEVATATPEPAKPKLPESFRELNGVTGYFIDCRGVDDFANERCEDGIAKELFASEAYAKSALAFAQLSQIYERWKSIEFPDWKTDWKNMSQNKYIAAVFSNGDLKVFCFATAVKPFPFPVEDLCQRFINCPAIAALLREFYMVKGER